MKRKAIELGCEIRTRTKVNKIIVENGKAIGVQLENGEIIYGENIITTIDTKVAMKELVGIDTISLIDPEYAKKTECVKMSPSAMTISLGLDSSIDLASLGLDCGYNVITTGKGTFEKLFQVFDKGEYMLDEK
jgi:phytoene dehydrogenase-like protein